MRLDRDRQANRGVERESEAVRLGIIKCFNVPTVDGHHDGGRCRIALVANPFRMLEVKVEFNVALRPRIPEFDAADELDRVGFAEERQVHTLAA